MTRDLSDMWPDASKPVIGMLHLPPLPGSPRSATPIRQVIEHAIRDADALAAGGVSALMLENFGDVPFHPARVPAETVAAMTAIAIEVRKRFQLPLGINVLRNDGQSALVVAVARGAEVIRVNVLCGARVTDQGIIQGIAHEVLRDRRRLGAANVKILADVDVKHSAPLGPRLLEDQVQDLLHRGLADAVIVSGPATGKTTDLDHVRRVKVAAGDSPVFIGSGVTAETIGSYLLHADGFIIGTAFKHAGKPEHPVDAQRVRALVKALKQCAEATESQRPQREIP